jgi:hypothetical protein
MQVNFIIFFTIKAQWSLREDQEKPITSTNFTNFKTCFLTLSNEGHKENLLLFEQKIVEALILPSPKIGRGQGEGKPGEPLLHEFYDLQNLDFKHKATKTTKKTY